MFPAQVLGALLVGFADEARKEPLDQAGERRTSAPSTRPTWARCSAASGARKPLAVGPPRRYSLTRDHCSLRHIFVQ
jgi:hypothetical protein